MADTRLSTTRRGLLAASLAIPAAALATSTPAAALATTGDRSAWNGLVADYRAAKAAQEAATPAFNQSEREYYRRKPKAPEQPASPPINGDMTINEIKALPSVGWADYERDKAAWQQTCTDLHREIVDDAEAVWVAACDRVTAAVAALAAFPASDLAMLREKADALAGEYGDDFGAGDEARCILADIRNLTQEA